MRISQIGCAFIFILFLYTNAQAVPFQYTLTGQLVSSGSDNSADLYGSFTLSDPVIDASSILWGHDRILYSVTALEFHSELFEAKGSGHFLLDTYYGVVDSYFSFDAGRYYNWESWRPIWNGAYNASDYYRQPDTITFAYNGLIGLRDTGELGYSARDVIAYRAASVPEPSLMLLIGTGIFLFAGIRRTFKVA